MVPQTPEGWFLLIIILILCTFIPAIIIAVKIVFHRNIFDDDKPIDRCPDEKD